jgi:hypothetical protein
MGLLAMAAVSGSIAVRSDCPVLSMRFHETVASTGFLPENCGSSRFIAKIAVQHRFFGGIQKQRFDNL